SGEDRRRILFGLPVSPSGDLRRRPALDDRAHRRDRLRLDHAFACRAQDHLSRKAAAEVRLFHVAKAGPSELSSALQACSRTLLSAQSNTDGSVIPHSTRSVRASDSFKRSRKVPASCIRRSRAAGVIARWAAANSSLALRL